MDKPYVVGITGCSGSGKTYFLNKLVEHFEKEQLAVLSMDNYYKPITEQVRDENNVVNFDLLESIDREAFHQGTLKLVNGETVWLEEYVFNVRDVTPSVIEIQPAPIVIVEGIFSFYYEEVFDEMDLKIFVESTEEIMLNRRIERDEKERGYHDRSIRYRFEHHVLPSYREFVLPGRMKADLIVPNDLNFDVAFDLVSGFLKSRFS